MTILTACHDPSVAEELKKRLAQLDLPCQDFSAAPTTPQYEPLLLLTDTPSLPKSLNQWLTGQPADLPVKILFVCDETADLDIEKLVANGIDEILSLESSFDFENRIALSCKQLQRGLQTPSRQNSANNDANRSRQLFKNMRSGAAVYQVIDGGADFIFTDFNDAAEKIDKISREKVLGQRVTKIFPGVVEFGLLEVMKRVWQSGKPEHLPISVYRDKRLQGWRDNYVFSLPSGELTTIYDDLTELKQVEQDLHLYQERLSFALHGANSGIWDWDLENDNLYFDENYYLISGYDPYEFPCAFEEWHKRVHPDDLEGSLQLITPTLEGEEEGFTTEFRFRTKSGDWIWIFGQGKAIRWDDSGVPTRIAGMHTDITEKKKAEQALLNSESRIASLLRVAPTGIGMVVNRILQAPNQKMCDITGYSADELVGQSARKLYPTEEEFCWVGDETDRQISKHGTGTVETRWRRKDGKLIDVLLSSTPINSKNLQEGVIFTALDISEQKHAENALRENEENLRTILKSIGEAVIAVDFQQRIISFNPIASQLTEYTTEEAIGKNLKQVLHLTDPGTDLKLTNIIRELLDIPPEKSSMIHYTLKPKKGADRQISCSAAPIIDQRGSVTGAVLIFRDISEELRNREELQRMQTLESVGILAGGIAHDFNNILMGLFGNITMAKRKLDPDHPSYDNLQKAENSADRAKNLTGKLLTFAKGGEPIRDHVSLAELVKDIAVFDPTCSNVKLLFTHPDDLWAADVDKGQIQQVFSNLTTNANQAMPDGGQLHISLENLNNSKNEIKGLDPKKYVKAVVKDTGTGINKDDLKRIFDPYFSTKQAGSGLGLATAYSIIHKHQGQIEVSSTPGKGTTFTLYLPATDAAPSDLHSATSQDRHCTVRSARVLIMDDEEIILDLVSEMLKNLGHTACTAIDVNEAVARYRDAMSSENNFDLVILDLTIPGGPGGQQAVKEILDINPQAKVIVASGYAEDPVMAHCTDYGFKGVISKPYSFEELQKVLQETLSA